MSENVKIIAAAGKGGVGKTSVSAAFVRLLAEAYPDKRILAIDADPATGLSVALGVEVGLTLDDIRKSIVENISGGKTREAVEMLNEARFHVLDALAEKDGFSFIAIGRPETAGCYCKVNAYLKEVIELISKDFDYVVIDGEAGIEQINRRVMEKVTSLVLVSDASRKGIQVINTVKEVADGLVMYDEYGVILNRVPSGFGEELAVQFGEKLLAVIPDDPAQMKNDISGDTVFALDNSSPLLAFSRAALEKLGLL